MPSGAAPIKYHEPVQGTIYHGDGREELLEKTLLEDPALQNSPTSDAVLEAIAEFAKKHYLMNVGDSKGNTVEKLIQERKPKIILEIGTYVGSSGIMFGRHIPGLYPKSKYPKDWTSDSTEDRAGYISLEKSPVYAKTARTAFKLAGVQDVIRVIEGSSTRSLKDLRKTINMPKPLTFDMIFIDHYKPLYTNDLKVLEDEGLVGPGTCIVADNVVKPGNPPYLSWVRATPAQKRESLTKPRPTSQPEVTPNPNTQEEWEVAFRDGPLLETRWIPEESEGVEGVGNPDLIYGHDMAWGHDEGTAELDAIEISPCTGIEQA